MKKRAICADSLMIHCDLSALNVTCRSAMPFMLNIFLVSLFQIELLDTDYGPTTHVHFQIKASIISCHLSV